MLETSPFFNRMGPQETSLCLHQGLVTSLQADPQQACVSWVTQSDIIYYTAAV